MRRLALVLPFAASALTAQSVRGTVSDAGGIRVPGVVIQLITPTDSVVSRALSDANGAFLVATPRPGEYRVRTLRIGFKAVTSEPITLIAGQQIERQFELAGVAVQLSDVRIESESGCRRSIGDSTSVAFAAWEQLRTALTATQITAFSRGMTVTTIEYNRALDPLARRVLSDETTVRTASVRQPWAERSADLIRRDGYVVEDVVGGLTYHVPGIEALGSNGFLEDHCLRLSTASSADQLWITFEPTPERKDKSEVRGTAILDRKTSELREVRFGYANIPDLRRDGAGGNIEFTRMRDGTWVITRWHVRMPEIEQQTKSAAMGGVELKLAGIRENGAQLSVARVGGDTLWRREPLPIEGTIVDSVTNKPMAGAIASLAGTGAIDTTDARGRFTLRAVPGEYQLEIRTPSLDSVKAVHQTKIAFVDSSATFDFKVPNAAFIRSVLERNNRSVFTGVVLSDSTKQPLRDVEVTIPTLSLAAKTDSMGRFRIAAVPAGVHKVIARKVGLGAYEAPTYFLAGHVVQREIHLSRLTELAAVNVTATATESNLPVSFEEHKALGLGKFITRDIIEKQNALGLQSILTQLTNVRIVAGGAGDSHKAYLATSRMPSARLSCDAAKRLYGSNTYCGMPRNGCYAQVWLDGFLLNNERPTPPFDVNSVMGDQVEAIEWYAGPAQTPPKYSVMNATCGVLVIHTRK